MIKSILRKLIAISLAMILTVSLASCQDSGSSRRRAGGAPDGNSDGGSQTGTQASIDNSDPAGLSSLPKENDEPEIIISYGNDGSLLICAKGNKFLDYTKLHGFSIRFY
ncbi:MAG: hypothetical protein K6G57_02715, partial [Lachnospiraceae bacterium]|nr:hypothetical protein [Lachnospiraceae bacterium]